jgi:prolyl oligopeptidase
VTEATMEHTGTDAPGNDPYAWLEEIDGARAMAWVAERNAESGARLAEGERFEQTRSRLREVLDAKDRIPMPEMHGGYLYNFWRDARNPRGLWRRTTLAGYRLAEPDWRVLVDLDRLAEVEGENWVWQGAIMLRPGGTRALVNLSRGGGDAAVVREFDLERRAFVPDGFILPEAKSVVAWIDQDTVYVGTDEGPGSLTDSGYPRLLREWRRGTPLSDAALVYAGETSDVGVGAEHDPTWGHVRDLVYRWIDRLRCEVYLRGDDGKLRLVEAPDDALIDTHGPWLLVRLRSAWTVDETTYPAGCLLATPFETFMDGERDLSVLFEPDERTSLLRHARTQHHLILTTSTDVRSELHLLTGDRRGWRSTPLEVPARGGADMRQLVVADTDPDRGDAYLLISTGFTEPSTLWHGHAGAGRPEPLCREPDRFDTAGLTVGQHFAVSADGTRVPYFVIGRPGGEPGPTVLSGYGGFEIPILPVYHPLIGRGWLERGGTFVVANIRGGGEYGPAWHQAALRENRFRAYEDFAAVAADLVTRGVTTVDQLGAEGGSNGGLLMGVMLTGHPELFGALVIRQPLADMRRYHRLLAGASWMAEYGDPDVESDWAFLRRYSPYHNVSPDRLYPPALIATSTRDDRVHPAHARKLAARLAEHGHDVTYYENDEGGHAGAADHAQESFVWALMLEFLWRRLRG